MAIPKYTRLHISAPRCAVLVHWLAYLRNIRRGLAIPLVCCDVVYFVCSYFDLEFDILVKEIGYSAYNFIWISVQ